MQLLRPTTLLVCILINVGLTQRFGQRLTEGLGRFRQRFSRPDTRRPSPDFGQSFREGLGRFRQRFSRPADIRRPSPDVGQSLREGLGSLRQRFSRRPAGPPADTRLLSPNIAQGLRQRGFGYGPGIRGDFPFPPLDGAACDYVECRNPGSGPRRFHIHCIPPTTNNNYDCVYMGNPHGCGAYNNNQTKYYEALARKAGKDRPTGCSWYIMYADRICNFINFTRIEKRQYIKPFCTDP